MNSYNGSGLVDSESYRRLFALVILLVLSGFFSISETALTSLSKLKLKNMIDEDIRGAKKIEKLLSDPKRLIASILIGNNLVNIGASSLTTVYTLSLTNNSKAVAIGTGLLTFIILVFCEITPKTLATEYAAKISLAVIAPLSFFVWLLTPFVNIMNFFTGGICFALGVKLNRDVPLITENELKTIVDVSHDEGVLKVNEKQMIYNVIAFDDLKARDIMIPRTDITLLSYDTEYSEIGQIFREEGFSRLPVFRENTDDIIGVLHLKDYFFASKEGFTIESVMRQPVYTYESKPIVELFNEMRAERVRVAIILDEYGGTSGFVSLEDIIEKIVGDISDEYDDIENAIDLISENEYVIDGSTRINEVNEVFHLNLKSEDYETIGGYVIDLIGRIPEENEVINDGLITFTIDKIDKNRIRKVRITKVSGENIS